MVHEKLMVQIYMLCHLNGKAKLTSYHGKSSERGILHELSSVFNEAVFPNMLCFCRGPSPSFSSSFSEVQSFFSSAWKAP